jgi:L-asparaginase II
VAAAPITIIDVLRGPVVESSHRVHIAVWHAERGLIAASGDAAHVSFVRSAIKMFQALPLVENGGIERLGVTGPELALCTASHGGEPFHVTAARSMLARAGVGEERLACGPHPPLHPASADALRALGEAPSRIHNNCSGKHAGLIAFTAGQGWAVDGYHLAAHPTERRVLEVLTSWMAVPAGAIGLAVDGCGLPTYAMPLQAVARGCACFAAAAADGQPAPSQVFRAMAGHPEYVAGSGRLCTDLMRAAGGTLFAKVGAEGYYCAGIPAMRLGLALKVEDGATRAAEPALLAALRRLEAIDDRQLAALDRYAAPPLRNSRREVVGSLRVRLAL